MLISKYTLFRDGYLWEWHATLHKNLLRNYHLKCGSRIARFLTEYSKFLTECHMHGTPSGPGDRTAKQDRSILERSPAKSL